MQTGLKDKPENSLKANFVVSQEKNMQVFGQLGLSLLLYKNDERSCQLDLNVITLLVHLHKCIMTWIWQGVYEHCETFFFFFFLVIQDSESEGWIEEWIINYCDWHQTILAFTIQIVRKNLDNHFCVFLARKIVRSTNLLILHWLRIKRLNFMWMRIGRDWLLMWHYWQRLYLTMTADWGE